MNRTLAANPPNGKSNQTQPATDKKNEESLTKLYSSMSQGQLGEILNEISTGKIEAKTKISATTDAGKITGQLKEQFTTQMQKFIDDPKHQELFLDQLIAMFDFYVILQKSLIEHGEKLLGNSNQLVVQVKQSYASNLKYLQALKQQKIMLEQTKNSRWGSLEQKIYPKNTSATL